LTTALPHSSQIVPQTAAAKRILKPLEPTPPPRQHNQPTKAKSKFFTSKSAAEPAAAYSAKPKRAAAERVTRQDYAESDSDESPVPMVAKTSTKTLVSKGKPSAASLIQQQQHRSTRQQRLPSASGKTFRNSEESDASDGSSEQEPIPPISIPAVNFLDLFFILKIWTDISVKKQFKKQ
jgi:hypothetical protein